MLKFKKQDNWKQKNVYVCNNYDEHISKYKLVAQL